MNPASVSSINCGGGDRLTQLPDHIRVHILTFLPIKDAILTSLLSKDWINLWSQLPTLVLTHDPERDEGPSLTDNPNATDVRAFTNFVDRVLNFHKSHHLDRFYLSFKFHAKHHEKLVHVWLRFVVARNVKHIDLLFNTPYGAEGLDIYCNIPSFLLRSDVLVSLNLKSCRLTSCAIEIIQCKTLTSVSLKCCILDEKFMDKLLLGCPGLKRLKLVWCAMKFDLNICHQGLKELDIRSPGVKAGILRISAPRLISLSLSGDIIATSQLSNLSSVLEAYIDVPTYSLSFFKRLKVKDVLARMTNVKKLTFRSMCLEALSLPDTTQAPFSISSCKSLVLYTPLNNHTQPHGLACLLQSCPRLETLTLNVWNRLSFPWRNDDRDARTNFWNSQLGDVYFSFLDHLRNVNVIGLAPHHPETIYVTEFLQFILEHCKVLKNLSIKVRYDDGIMWDKHTCLKSISELSQTLLSYPRLSREAEIQITVD